MRAGEGKQSYLTPLAGHWNKHCRVCFQPHTDTSRNLTGLTRLWKGLRFRFVPGPAE